MEAGPILVTGAAGFIGYHLARRLLEEGLTVIGLDNLNAYYTVRLKEARLARLERFATFTLARLSLEDRDAIMTLFEDMKPKIVVNLAAQAGVRYSLQNPHAYVDSNIVGFLNILEGCRHHDVAHLVYASTSSVYGTNTKMPFSVHDNVDHPVSLYAATKKANELMAHTYSHLYDLPTTGLRFFTVYGPWGRPDMAMFIFTKAIIEGRPIEIFNHGRMKRDFTYIDDIIEGVRRVMTNAPQPDPDWSSHDPDPGTSKGPFKIYNIGNNQSVELMTMIQTLEAELGIQAEKIMRPMQPGDVPETFADVDDLMRDVGFKPSTPLQEGIKHFVHWYRHEWQE